MFEQVDKSKGNKNKVVDNSIGQKKSAGKQVFGLVDNRPEAVVQRKLQEMVINSPEIRQATQFKGVSDNYSTQHPPIVQKKGNDTGLPDNLKSSIESLSGYSMDDVKVHYNSEKPAQLQAHAYAQGNQIHLGPSQEKQLPHEAWHVVQQKQGRVQLTTQSEGAIPINEDPALENEADVMGVKASQFLDNRQEATQMKKQLDLANGNLNIQKLAQFQKMANAHSAERAVQLKQPQFMVIQRLKDYEWDYKDDWIKSQTGVIDALLKFSGYNIDPSDFIQFIKSLHLKEFEIKQAGKSIEKSRRKGTENLLRVAEEKKEEKGIERKVIKSNTILPTLLLEYLRSKRNQDPGDTKGAVDPKVKKQSDKIFGATWLENRLEKEIVRVGVPFRIDNRGSAHLYDMKAIAAMNTLGLPFKVIGVPLPKGVAGSDIPMRPKAGGQVADIDMLYIPGAPVDNDTQEEGTFNPKGNEGIRHDEAVSRNHYELLVISQARTKGIPILAICAGSWRLLQSYGGGVVNLPEPERDKHKAKKTAETWTINHPLDIQDGLTVLGGMSKDSKKQIQCANTTHWAVAKSKHGKLSHPESSTMDKIDEDSKKLMSAKPGKDLRITANTGGLGNNPTVEAFESKKGMPAMGIQFHPESNLPGMPSHKDHVDDDIGFLSKEIFSQLAKVAVINKRQLSKTAAEAKIEEGSDEFRGTWERQIGAECDQSAPNLDKDLNDLEKGKTDLIKKALEAHNLGEKIALDKRSVEAQRAKFIDVEIDITELQKKLNTKKGLYFSEEPKDQSLFNVIKGLEADITLKTEKTEGYENWVSIQKKMAVNDKKLNNLKESLVKGQEEQVKKLSLFDEKFDGFHEGMCLYASEGLLPSISAELYEKVDRIYDFVNTRLLKLEKA